MEHVQENEVQITICVKKYRRLQGEKRSYRSMCRHRRENLETGERIKSICKDKELAPGEKSGNDTAHSGKKVLLHMMIPV